MSLNINPSEPLKYVFINCATQNGGKIPERFYQAKHKFTSDESKTRLENIKNNVIQIPTDKPYIYLLKEMKHFTDAWADEKGNYHLNWMSKDSDKLDDVTKRIRSNSTEDREMMLIDHPITGIGMSEATTKLFSIKACKDLITRFGPEYRKG